jgi:heptosyltransferase-2
MNDKILILWIGRLGDFAVSLKFLSGIKKKYINTELIFVGTNRNVELAYISDIFNSIYCYPLKLTPVSIFKIVYFYLKLIFLKKYFMVIDLNTSYSSSSFFIMKFVKAIHKVSFVKDKRNCYTIGIVVEELMPTRYKYRKMAEKLEIIYDEKYNLPSKKIDIRKKLDIVNDYPVFAIFAGNFSKTGHRWPPEKFIEISNLIEKKIPHLNQIYITDENEFKILKNKILSYIKARFVICKDLKELCNVISSVDLLLTNNTGPLHIAELLGISTISINTDYSAACWLPETGKHFYIKSGDWKSCHKIPVEEVFDKIVYSLKELGLEYK